MNYTEIINPDTILVNISSKAPRVYPPLGSFNEKSFVRLKSNDIQLLVTSLQDIVLTVPEKRVSETGSGSYRTLQPSPAPTASPNLADATTSPLDLPYQAHPIHVDNT